MWNKVATGILVLITAGVIAAVFTVPSLGWLTKTEGALYPFIRGSCLLVEYEG